MRQIFLLLASWGLYLSWGSWFGAVLLGSTLMNFYLGKWIRRQPTAGAVWTGALLNLALLASFKYLPEAATSLPFSSLGRFAHLALPLGISFWTFQAMSYLFDQYRGEELDPTFIEFALYMAFFPVAISGPICRIPEMLPQFRSHKLAGRSDIARGIARVATGLLMMQIAQLLGRGILGEAGLNAGFDQSLAWTGSDVWCLAFGYGLQLFFDFAGYTHIAIGAARMLGFDLPENFARPFSSSSVSVFWTRWHMSLSFWIRDYVFLPMAVLRREMWWRNFALVVAMVLFGIWHRGTLLLALFGCYHGVLLVLHRQVQAAQRRMNWEPPASLWTPLSWILTLATISLGWLPFRANSWAELHSMIASLIAPASYAGHALPRSLYLLVAAVGIAYAVALTVIDALEKLATRETAGTLGVMVRDRWTWLAPMYVAALVLVITILHGQSGSSTAFLYRFF